MRSLVIGSRGFVGPHLEHELLEREHDVYEFDLKLGDDVRYYEQVRQAIERYEPDYIFNLAAMAYVGESQLNPQRAVDIHVKGTINVLEAVRNLGVRPKILLTSTSEEYGYENQTQPITEASPTLPTNIYGATKSAMTNVAMSYIKHHGLQIVVTRAFNHIGAGQGPQPVLSAFAKQIAAIERGENNILRHGNLESTRNYTNVRDIVRAYANVINAEPGVYNVCSDDNVSIQTLLDMLCAISTKEIETEVDERLYRPDNLVFQTPSYAKIQHAVGWTPRVTLDNSVKEVLDYWRERII